VGNDGLEERGNLKTANWHYTLTSRQSPETLSDKIEEFFYYDVY
jgi:hypothetical protein